MARYIYLSKKKKIVARYIGKIIDANSFKMILVKWGFDEFSFPLFAFDFLKVYPPTDWLVGSSLPSKFSPGTIQRALEELSIDNIR